MGRGLVVFLLTLAGTGAPRAEPPVPAADPRSASFDSPLGQSVRYLVERIEVRGNRKTETGLILRELGISPGDVLTPDDVRVRAASLRLRSLGFFLDVNLGVVPSTRRGVVVLVVEVEERGTVVLNQLSLGTSEATLLWGGLDLTETNLFGRGIALGGGFVASTTPTVPEAKAGRAFTVRAAGPPRRSGLLLSGDLTYASGSEFFQAFGPGDDVDPSKWRAVNVRRLGGTLTAGGQLSRTARFLAQGHLESIDAELPDIRTRDLGEAQASPIDFQIYPGHSRLASLAAIVEFDTRSDPVLPARGRRISISAEVGLPVLGSSYTYAKGVATSAFYWPAFRDHVVSVHGFAGAIFGDTPFFNRFFIADLNFLLPPRALGLNFSTLPTRNFLGTNIVDKRYESFAGRVLVEYAVPLWRRGGFVYRGDAFATFGIFGLAGLDDLRVRETSLGQALPLDLTADLGIRLDTYIGIFTLSIGNGLGRIPF